jgi:membrane protease YdiL (CAAX protease family)
MDDTTQEQPSRPLPFSNLYLISGLVHGQNKGWMYLFTFVLLLLGYTGFQLLIFYPLKNMLVQNGYTEMEIFQNVGLIFDSNALKIDRNIVFLLELMMFVVAFLGFYAGIRLIHRKTLTSVLTGYAKFRYRRFWFAFLVWGTLIVVGVLCDYILNPEEYILHFNLPGFLVSVIIMVILMPVQTGLEEVLFRGYFVQGLSQIFKNGVVPLLLTSLLFAFAHMTNPEVQQFGWEIMITYYACVALFMGGITLLDEGLELAFGIHFANNMISSMLVSAPHSVIKTYSVFEVTSEDPHAEIVVWCVMAIITFAIFRFRYRWKDYKLIIK